MRVALVAAVLAFSEDVGYERLMEDALDEVADVEVTMSGSIPSYAVGSFFLTGPGRFSMGKEKMTHVFDGFAKVHKWSFKNGKVRFTSKFLPSEFLNNSLAKNAVDWGVLAQETDPPRKNPGPIGFLKAPNDNQGVNMVKLGSTLELLSDTTTFLGVDPETLDFKEQVKGLEMANQSNPLGDVCSQGSAHPYTMEDGSYLSLREANKLTGAGKERMALYRVHPESHSVMDTLAYFDVPRASYSHSFGITRGRAGGDLAVVLAQPVFTNIAKLMSKATMQAGFETPEGVGTMIHVVPLDGTEQVAVETRPFFFSHFANSWSSGPKKVSFDVAIASALFMGFFDMGIQTNKTRRDNWFAENNNSYSTTVRFEVDLETKQVTEKELLPKGEACQSEIWCQLDLYKIHPDDEGKDYCGFWAWHTFANSTAFSSWAVSRVDLCAPGGARVVAMWKQENVYPSEPTFVPKPGSKDRTAGVVMFKVFDGNKNESRIVVTDATTLETISEGVLPIHIPFSVHGRWYGDSSSVVV
mmetsp:Transcript_92996/g.212792  ORF Transcript_92996/g.212792 Transcript_92996/m.212792 type:complete len:526 (+) Transcript_92996:67-1644(+)